MKKLRKVMLLLAGMLVMLVAASTQLKAEEVNNLQDGDYLYTINDDNQTVTITGYTGIASELSIPSTLGGMNVTVIGYQAFYNNDVIVSVIIPEGVTEIAVCAFEDCDNLSYIQIPDSVVKMNVSVFRNSEKLQMAGAIGTDCNIEFGWTQKIPNFAFDGSEITEIVIPEGMTCIGSNAFTGCNKLTKVVIPSSVTTMSSAFYMCPGLKTAGPIGGDYNIELGWTAGDEIPDYAFKYSEIISIVIPDGVTRIGREAFWLCDKLTSVVIPESVVKFCTDNGAGNNVFYSCTGLETAGGIGSGCNIEFGWTTKIPKYAFSGSSITKVTIPDGITSVENCAFENCKMLSKVIIPESLVDFEYAGRVFKGCEKLMTAGGLGSGCNIEFGWKEEIPEYAFSGDDALISVTIPDGITKIAYGAFSFCKLLSKVVIPESVVSITSGAFICSEKLITAGGLESGCNIEFGWKEEIPEYAFDGNKTLISVTIPDGIDKIGLCAFRDCSSLEQVVLTEGIKKIEAYAFDRCTSLKKINLPGSIEKSSYAFTDCSNLKTVGPLNSGCNIEYGWTASIILGAFAKSCIEEFTLSEDVKEIGNSAFADCASLKKVNLHENIVKIGSYAFRNCTSLEKLYLPGSIETMGSASFAAFFNCSNLKTAGPKGSECDIEFGWTETIPAYTFKDSCVESVIIPDGVKEIKNSVLSNCENLSKVVVPASVDSILENAFLNCPKLVLYGYSNNAIKKYADDNNISFEALDKQDTHVHDFSDIWTSDAAYHWHACEAEGCDGTVEDKSTHTAGDWIIDKEATLSEEGSRHKECKVCSFIMERAIIPKKVEETTTEESTEAEETTEEVTTEESTEAEETTEEVTTEESTEAEETTEEVTTEESTKAEETTEEVTTEESTKAEETTEEVTTEESTEAEETTEEVTTEESSSEFGKVEVPENNSNNGKFAEGEDVMSKINLTEEEKRQVESGQELVVTLKVEDINNTDYIGGEAVYEIKATIQNSIGESTLGTFLNIDLLKTIGENQSKITETLAPVKITLQVPDELKNTNNAVTRNYQVIRYHEGMVETLPTVYNDGVITFTTDKFSVYALVYSDTSVVQEETSASEEQSTVEEPSTVEEQSTTVEQSAAEEQISSAAAEKTTDETEISNVTSPSTGNNGGEAYLIIISVMLLAGLIINQRGKLISLKNRKKL